MRPYKQHNVYRPLAQVRLYTTATVRQRADSPQQARFLTGAVGENSRRQDLCQRSYAVSKQ
jgi:hypothetical protein